MTNVVGGNIEQKSIGLKFGVEGSGTFENTELINGIVQLIEVDKDWDENPVYIHTGSWTSDIIDIGDNFSAYGKVFTSFATLDSYTTIIHSRTSSDGIDFEEWKLADEDGTINSTKNQFIQVRIVLHAELESKTKEVSSFNSDEESAKFDNPFIDTTEGLKLKRDYLFEMTKDESWNDDGQVFRLAFNKNDWLKVNELTMN